jgi:hypothetical protein
VKIFLPHRDGYACHAILVRHHSTYSCDLAAIDKTGFQRRKASDAFSTIALSHVSQSSKIESIQRVGEDLRRGRVGETSGRREEGGAVVQYHQDMMPGLLKRPHNLIDIASARSAADEKPDNMTEERPAKRRAGDVVNGDVQLNGDSPATNGIYANGKEVDPVVSPEKIEEVLKTVSTQLPPEIDHITQGYLPLSKLIIRLAQDTFNGLTEAINEMADMKPSQSTGQSQMNGITPSQAIQVNVQKKTRLWDFAQDRRAKFIKILVLSQWSRQAEAVSKVIDLNHWLRVQKEHYRSAVNWIGELKRLLGPMIVPRPELDTALEALSTGKASWLPDVSTQIPAIL